MTDNIKQTESQIKAEDLPTNITQENKDPSSKDSPSNSPEKPGLADRIIHEMDRLELAATHNPVVNGIRNRIDAVRLSLQKDTTGGEGKLFAQFKETEEGKNLFPKDKTTFSEEELKNIQEKFNNYKQSQPKRSFGKALGDGAKQFGKSTAGFFITLGVQVVNSGIKTGALLFNTGKLGIMAVGAAAGSKFCKKNLKEEAANWRSDLKSTVVSYINTFAVATGIGALVGAKAGVLYSATQATNALADSIGKGMGFTAAQVEDLCLMKKGAAMTAELNKSEYYKKTASIMEQRDPKMYERLVKLRAEHIDKEGVSIEEKRAAAVLEKEMLETFRNNQNSMVGMPVRAARKALAWVTGKAKTEKEYETIAHSDQHTKVDAKDGKNAVFHAVTLGAFKSFEDRQKEGHEKIDHHEEHFKEYLKMRKTLETEHKGDYSKLSKEEQHEYLNLHRAFGKKSFSREM